MSFPERDELHLESAWAGGAYQNTGRAGKCVIHWTNLCTPTDGQSHSEETEEFYREPALGFLAGLEALISKLEGNSLMSSFKGNSVHSEPSTSHNWAILIQSRTSRPHGHDCRAHKHKSARRRT